jgi:hypothetical protein
MIKKSYITSRPWGGAAGIGHQFYNWVVGWMLANRYGLNYVYSPFCGDKIVPGNIDVPVKHWNHFLNFSDQEIQEKDLPPSTKVISLPKILSCHPSAEMLTTPNPKQARYQVGYDIHTERQEWQNLIERYRDQQVLFECAKNQFITIDWQYLKMKKLQDKYWKNRPMETDNMPVYFDKNKLNVVIHIRRGDVTKNGRYKVRWVSNDFYKTVMNQIRQTIKNCKIKFLIFSDATKISEFDHLLADDVSVKLWGTNTLNVFRHMTMADILVTGQSSFSCLAGLLNKGTKIVKPWGPLWSNFPKQSNFIEVSQEGFFDTNKLEGY